MISFNAIPVDFRTVGHHIEFDSSRAVRGLSAQPHRVLVLGQRLTAGTVGPNVPTRVLSGAQAEEYFGRGSMLAEMLKAFRAANPLTELWACAQNEDAGGVAATGSIVFGGPTTKAGTLNLYIGGKKVKASLAAGTTGAQAATAASAAIAAATDLPVTATTDGATLDLACKWKGLTGNAIDIRVNYYEGESLPAGLTVAITPMADGTTAPSLAASIAAIGDVHYHTWIVPYTDATSLTAIEAELELRWGPMVQLEGHAFAAITGSHADITTLGESRNSHLLTIIGGGSSPTPSWIWSAVTGAVDAAEPDPARPRQTLPLTGVLAPASSAVFTREERDLLLHSGVSTFIVDASGRVLIERLITTYRLNALSVPDTSYLDVTTLRTLAYLRFSLRSRIALRYPRHKLADDGTRFGAGQAVVTPSTIRSEVLSLFGDWERAGLVEGFEQFRRELIVERNAGDRNRLDALLSPDLMNQFIGFAGQVQFLV